MIALILAILVVAFGTGLLVGWQARGDLPHNSFSRVKEFHKAFGHPVADRPTLLDDGRMSLRVELISEELDEYRQALEAKDIVAVADALGDLDYVVNGAAIEHGINLPKVTAEIHRSNMTKLGPGGLPIYREDGKILKGENYTPPNLEPVLGI